VARYASQMMTRWMLLLCLTACGPKPGPTTTTATPIEAGEPTAGVLSADGTRVRRELVYVGDCAPAGSRGGCHTITLRPDGTYRNFLYDAAIDGTYVISGGMVKLTASDPSLVEELPLSADGNELGTMKLTPVGHAE
jgi:hypothetical protein